VNSRNKGSCGEAATCACWEPNRGAQSGRRRGSSSGKMRVNAAGNRDDGGREQARRKQRSSPPRSRARWKLL